MWRNQNRWTTPQRGTGMLRVLGYIDDAITALENSFLGALMLFSASMICAQIIARSVFGSSFIWAEESVRYAIIFMVFIGSAVAFRMDAHISIDALHHWVTEPMRKILVVMVNLSCLLLAMLLIYYGMELVTLMQGFGQTSPALEVPMYWVYAVIPGSAVLMAYRLMQSTVRLLQPSAAKRLEQPSHAIVE
jgi:TRAP-type C4-dicarboxylate transport system permease small subunit